MFGRRVRLPVDFNRLAEYNMDDMIELHANAKDPNQEQVVANQKEAKEKVFN